MSKGTVEPEWYDAVDLVASHIVQISTPRGFGTGFFISSSPTTGLCAIATAAHVVADSDWWEEPIRLHHPGSGESRILRQSGRVIHVQHDMDTAAIVFPQEGFPFPQTPMACISEKDYLRVGNEIGWVGFPGVAVSDMCFFSGRISAWRERELSYLVDGVAINGVSGGPAFMREKKSGVQLIGVVSAYIPNLVTGMSLPGLSVVRDVTQIQGVVKSFRTMEDAASKATPPPPPVPAGPGLGQIPSSR